MAKSGKLSTGSPDSLQVDSAHNEESLSGLWLHPVSENSSNRLLVNSTTEFIQHRDDESDVADSSNSQGVFKQSPGSAERGNLRRGTGTWIQANFIEDDYDFPRKKAGVHKSRSTVPSFREVTSWEIWWIQSQLWTRWLILLLLIFFVVAILQLTFGIYLFLDFFSHKVPDPSVCRTEKCVKMSKWLLEGFNEHTSPCDNFWNFTCGNHTRKDIGNLKKAWYEQFARLESDGESLLAKLLKKPDSDLTKATLKFYQACMDLRQREATGLSLFSTIISETFRNFSFDDTTYPQLEHIALRMIEMVGDYGLFTIREPIKYPSLYYAPFEKGDDFIEAMGNTDASNSSTLLFYIYEGLKIPTKIRDKITLDVLHMVHTLRSSLKKGQPNTCNEDVTQLKHYLDLNYSIWTAYLGANSTDSKELTPGSHLKTYSLKDSPKYELSLVMHPDYTSYFPEDPLLVENYENLFKCWNYWMQRIPVENIRMVYATFWSMRIFFEIEDEFDTKSINKNKLSFNPMLNSQRHRDNSLRRLQARCFESIQHKMGYYPMFSIFENSPNVDDYLKMVNAIINKTATGLLGWYLPPEEGGYNTMSSFYRERAENILSGREDTAILIPVREDDSNHRLHQHHFAAMTTNDHIRNVLHWEKYVLRRKSTYWKSGTPKGRLIWYYRFYELESVDAYETPGYAAYSILKFPISLFLYPYIGNDILAAEFAGSYYLGSKAWLALTYFDHFQDNVKEVIDHRKLAQEMYTEGIHSDGDYEPCQLYYYRYNSNREWSRKYINPHIFQTNYGSSTGDAITESFYIGTTIKTAYKLFMKEKEKLAKIPYWKLTRDQQNHAKYKHLEGFEDFSDKQLFFMTVGRHFCRSKENTEEYRIHSTRFLSSLMNMEEFAEAWSCPIGSPMNPPNKCFGSS